MDGAADRGPAVEGVAIQFIVLAVGSFALRAYVRVHMVRAWGWDDWMMALATCTFVLFMFNVLAGVHYGVGRHQAALSTEDVLMALKVSSHDNISSRLVPDGSKILQETG